MYVLLIMHVLLLKSGHMFVLHYLQDEELYQLFSIIDNVGSSIEAIRVIRHPHMHLGKGIAYILFKTRV